MNANAAIDADITALASAAALAEEALALHRDALLVLTDGWRSESGCAAKDLILRQCDDAAELVTALQEVTADFKSLREDAADAQYAQTTARLNERPQPGFESLSTMPAYAAPAAAAAPGMNWPSGGLPNVGGALVGLVAQIADALIPEGADTSPPAEPPDEVNPPARHAAVPTDASVIRPVPPPVPVPELPTPVNPPVSQPQSSPEPPLLAAERPPEPESAPPAATVEPPVEPVPPQPAAPADPAEPEPSADPQTPCEIAADELPQVGE